MALLVVDGTFGISGQRVKAREGAITAAGPRIPPALATHRIRRAKDHREKETMKKESSSLNLSEWEEHRRSAVCGTSRSIMLKAGNGQGVRARAARGCCQSAQCPVQSGRVAEWQSGRVAEEQRRLEPVRASRI